MSQSNEPVEKPKARVFVVDGHGTDIGDCAEFEQMVSEHLFASGLPIESASVGAERIDGDNGVSGYDAVITIFEPDGGFDEADLHAWAAEAARDIALGN